MFYLPNDFVAESVKGLYRRLTCDTLSLVSTLNDIEGPSVVHLDHEEYKVKNKGKMNSPEIRISLNYGLRRVAQQ